MKVLVVGTGGSIVSGVSTAADEMVRTLVHAGHTAERLVAGERLRKRANTLNVENVAAVAADARLVRGTARRVNADLVWIHAMGVPLLPALRALALVLGARLSGRPAVVRFHAFALERSVEDGGIALRLALRALARCASGLVAEHEAAATALRRVVRSTKVHVLENWVDLPGESAPLRSVPPLRVAFVGGIVRRKGAPQLIEALRLLGSAPIEVRLVGGPAEDGAEAYRCVVGAASDLVETGRLAFVGEQDPAGVRRELRGCNLFTLPSEAEGMPLAMLEALAEGRPVLVTDAGNMRSVVEATGCGWVLADREPATIAAELRRLLDDPSAIAEASTAARRAAEERFSSGAVEARLHPILAAATSR